MFKRRNPQPLFLRIKDWIWPARGFQRSSKYIAHRLRRLPGTPYRIAAGFACGAATSFTPFIGLHFATAALICLVVRGNVFAAAIGTAVGNPWTFPFIWAWLYGAGRWMLGQEEALGLPQDLSLQFIVDNPWAVFWPMTISGIPTAIVAWFVFFFPVRKMVAEYQRARRWRIRRKVVKRRDQVLAHQKMAASPERAQERPAPPRGERETG